MPSDTLTQKSLKAILDYNQETGIFTRKKNGRPITKPNDNGYIRITINYKRYYAHRLAWLYVYGSFPEKQIDHINHDRSDNRAANLRCVSQQTNARNASMSTNNTSGVTGVYRCKRRRAWFSSIMINGKTKCLGYFKDKFEAICARKSVENKYGFHANHGRS